MSPVLLPHHRQLLDASAISKEIADARGYWSASDPAELNGRFRGSQKRAPALVIPVFNTCGEEAFCQLRPDSPREKDGKPLKYETPAKARMVLDVPPSTLPHLGNPDVTLWVTEGIRKADALASVGLCSIALLGVWNWRGRNEHGGLTALPDWHDVALNGRKTILAFDSDLLQNAGVYRAVEELGRWLEIRKAELHFVYLPSDGAKVGVDDYLAGHGRDELAALIEQRWRPLASEAANADAGTLGERAVGGGEFVFDTPAKVTALWGSGQEVLWAAGEPLMIAAPPGVGKTTLTQQLVLRRIGLRQGPLLNQPVAVGRRVLYVAADRPQQVARSLRRMVREDDREVLDERLKVWRGPLPFDLTKGPNQLATFTESYGADTLIIDSLKDIVVKLASDEVGAVVNMAIQECIALGIEVVSDHHQRKPSEGNREPRKLDDVYGSVWLTAGQGSVILLWGESGDPIVTLRHLKSPAEEIGPFGLTLDFITGNVTIHEASSLLGVLKDAPGGLSAHDAAAVWLGTSDVTAAKKEKARRALEKLVKDGRVTWEKGSGRNDPRIYRVHPMHPERAPIRGVHEAESGNHESPVDTGNGGARSRYTQGARGPDASPLLKREGDACTSEDDDMQLFTDTEESETAAVEFVEDKAFTAEFLRRKGGRS